MFGIGPFDSLLIGSYSLPIDTSGLSCTIFLRYLAGFKSVSINPSNPYTMTVTALEDMASSSGSNYEIDLKLFNYLAQL